MVVISGTKGPRLTKSLGMAALLLLQFAAFASAQDEGTPGGANTRPPAVGPIKRNDLSIIYLEKDGTWIPGIPGVSPAQVSEWYNVFAGLRTPMPRLMIKSIDVVAEVGQKTVTYKAVYEIERTKHKEDGWANKLLGFPNAHSMHAGGRPDIEGEGEPYVDAVNQGKVLWLKAKPDTQHKLTLNLIGRVTRSANESSLTFTLPTASARIRIRIPEPDIKAISPSEARRSVKGRTTVYEFESNGGPIQFRWAASKANPKTNTPTSFTYSATTMVRFLDQSTAQGEARLSLQSENRPIGPFQVRFPAGALPVPSPNSDFQLERVAAKQNLYRVVPSDKMATDLTLSLGVRWEGLSAKKPLDMDGFEIVEGVVRESSINVSTPNEFKLVANAREGVISDRVIPEGLRDDNISARFRYFRYPISLRLHVVREAVRVRVEPAFVYLVNANQTLLRGIVKCRMRGKGSAKLELNVEGWNVEVVDVAQDIDYTKSPLVVPLDNETGDETESIIRFQANRKRSSSDLSFIPPITVSSSNTNELVPVAIIVAPANNVQLSQVQFPGMTQDAFPPTLDLEELNGRNLLAYRVTDDTAAFRGSVKTLQRRINSSVSARVEKAERQFNVIETISVQIAFDQPKSLDMVLPSWVLDRDLSIYLKPASEESEGNEGQNTELIWELLPDDQMNRLDRQPSDTETAIVVRLGNLARSNFELLARYSLPLRSIGPSESQNVVVGLVEPLENESLTSKTLQVVTSNEFDVEIEGDWRGVYVGDQGMVERETGLPAEERLFEFQLTRTQRQSSRATSLDEIWIQSTLTAKRRRDRAVFRIRMAQPTLRFNLPENAELINSSIQVAINRQSLDEGWMISDSGELTIDIPQELTFSEQPLTVEIWYWMESREVVGGQSLNAIQMAGTHKVDRGFWEIVTRGDEHLFTSPDDYSAEFEWQWVGNSWRRVPTLDQRLLERMFEASAQPLPTGNYNRYLFGGSGEITQLELSTVTRLEVVAYASGCLLIFGLLFVHVGFMRRPTVLLVIGIALGASAVALPQLAPFLIQSALCGLLFSLSAMYIRWIVVRRERRVSEPEVTDTVTAVPRGEAHSGGTPTVELRRDADLLSPLGSSRASTMTSPQKEVADASLSDQVQ